MASLRFETSDYNKVVSSQKKLNNIYSGSWISSKEQIEGERIPGKGLRVLVGKFCYYLFESKFILLWNGKKKKGSYSPVKHSSSFGSLSFIMSNVQEEGNTSLVKHKSSKTG